MIIKSVPNFQKDFIIKFSNILFQGSLTNKVHNKETNEQNECMAEI